VLSSLKKVTDQDFLSTPEELIEEARNGRMFILVDDEDRENEGDLVVPAEFCNAETINFMARHGRGLICLALEKARCQDLGLPLMAQGNETRTATAFTHSIEAREGVTTGISAADRARTVAVAINPHSTRHDIGTPGHIFPLMARDGGVLVRAGHTEAAVDIPRLAGLTPAGVICEIMNDDGSMARLHDLVPFAQRHGLKIGAIAHLIEYRLRRDRLVKVVRRDRITSRFGGPFQLLVYESLIDGVEHMALVKGDITTPGAVLTRVHTLDLVRDVLGGGGPGDQVQHAMEEISKAGRGVIVMLRQPHATSISRSLADAEPGRPARHQDIRVYGIGAQILRDLGVQDMVLLSNTEFELIGAEGYGLHVVRTQPL
jgi:3,4-dihydroxy 2-butanone 4-phosphate synthase/GTP cyclohydrolase II